MRTTLSRIACGVSLLIAGTAAAHAASLDPALKRELATAQAAVKLEVIVTFAGHGALTTGEIASLTSLGLPGGFYLHTMPIVGTLATPAQIAQLLQLEGVLSVYANRQLAYTNYKSTQLTGVRKLRSDPAITDAAGHAFTGKGIGVLINDSGLDGTHPDLSYPSHTVQNVLGHADLASLNGPVAGPVNIQFLPFTPVENVPHSDLTGSHGTHVSGIVGAAGVQNGKFTGVAPEASLIGYGSGVAIAVLDALGGFDYANLHQADYNIRVINNSFGCGAGCTDAPLDPADPMVLLTKAVADKGVMVVFAAGNSGPGQGTIYDGYKKAPWVFNVAAGDKSGRLANFSSRGVKDYAGQSFTLDGQTYVTENKPLITAPGVDVISTRAHSSDVVAPVYGGSPISDEAMVQSGEMSVSDLPWYTTDSGTSMASPHLCGIIALMLQANPALKWPDVRRILVATATNLPGVADWEGGAGYVNAYAAVQMALGKGRPFGSTVNELRHFRASVATGPSVSSTYSLLFAPVGPAATKKFDVGGDVAVVQATAEPLASTVALVLHDPAGNRYVSSVFIPGLSSKITVVAPGMPGAWTLEVGGFNSVSGQRLSPPAGTVPFNGYGTPEPIDVAVTTTARGVDTNLDDIASHPLRGIIEQAVQARLIDGLASGNFAPNAALTRIKLAEYVTIGAVRQSQPFSRRLQFTDLARTQVGYAQAMLAPGAPLRDLEFVSSPLMNATGDHFNPNVAISRVQLAYTLVQGLGLQAQAMSMAGQPVIATDADGNHVPVTDLGALDPALNGYLQLALDAGFIAVEFQTIPATATTAAQTIALLKPRHGVSRVDYAGAALKASLMYGAHGP